MNIPNIPKIRKAIGIMSDIYNFKNKELRSFELKAFQTLLSACQLLCDTSDKMLPKMLIATYVEFCCEPLYDAYAKEKGYNLAREEDILWVTKKLMGLEEVIKGLYKTGKLRNLYECEMIDLINAIIQSFGQEKGGEEK